MFSITAPFTVSTFPPKRGSCRTITTKKIKLHNLRNAVSSSSSQGITTIEEAYNDISYVAPLKDNNAVIEQINFKNEHQLQNGVKKIKKMMSKKANELEELIIIDTIQRLGLENYFREDIQAILERHFEKNNTLENVGENLHQAALRFRLLRQGGYNARVDSFKKFKDGEGRFREELCHEIEGLLNLFEASALSMKEEKTMDEAGEFSKQLLKSSLSKNTDQTREKIIENTMRNSFHKRLARLFSKSFLQDLWVSLDLLHGFNGNKDWVIDLQELAKIDFELTQTSQKYEILRISRWGEELNSAKQLSFARIDPFKRYMWSFGTLPGPNMANERIELAKAVSFIYIIDDIFDVYGTPDELSLFTQAVNSWENADIEKLPSYMQVCFKALRDMVNDISQKVYAEHGWNPEETLKKLWADLCNAFLIEAKWIASKHLPSSTEYLRNGIVSSGVHAALGHAFFLLGEQIDANTVHVLSNLPSIVSSTAIVVRLWNDVGIDQDENRDGSDGSYVACYMNEHKSSAKHASQHVSGMIAEAWKCLNEEHFSRTSPFSTNFKDACLNVARMVPIMYSHDETAHLQNLKDHLEIQTEY